MRCTRHAAPAATACAARCDRRGTACKGDAATLFPRVVTASLPGDDVSQLDRDVWDDGALRFGTLLSPWVTQVDPGRWRQAVSKVAALDLHALTGAHGPVIRRRDVDHALDLMDELPDHPEPPAPDQRQLDAARSAMAPG